MYSKVIVCMYVSMMCVSGDRTKQVSTSAIHKNSCMPWIIVRKIQIFDWLPWNDDEQGSNAKQLILLFYLYETIFFCASSRYWAFKIDFSNVGHQFWRDKNNNIGVKSFLLNLPDWSRKHKRTVNACLEAFWILFWMKQKILLVCIN